MDKSITKYLRSDDPLSDDAIEFLLKYREEDDYVDYKETFDNSNDKEWMELAKDFMAFANSYGGYLLFGVQDSSYNLVGLDAGTLSVLKNTDMIQQKINRYADPEILNVRSKEYVKDDKKVVVLLILESPGKTYVVSRDAIHKFPSGGTKTILHKGTIYIRRSAGNHLCDSRDIDELVSKRIDQYKKSLLSNIARVVEAPAESDVFILSQDPTSESNKKFIIEDAPDAIKVKGMSFTISPETPEQEISAWISLSRKDRAALPPPKILWKWYSQRENIKLSEAQKLFVAKFCIISDVPAFFWLKGCPRKAIDNILDDACELIPSIMMANTIVGIAAFLGRSSYTRISGKLKKTYGKRFSSKLDHYPSSDPSCFFIPELAKSYPTKKSKDGKEGEKESLERLNEIVNGVTASVRDEPGVIERRTAHAIDCLLYAQHDRYNNI